MTAGDQARRQGRLVEATQQYQTALQIAEQEAAADGRVVTSLWKMGESHHAQKQHTEGEQLRRRALALQEERLGPDDPQVAELLRSLAFDCSNMGKPLEGVPLLERAQAIYEQTGGPGHEEIARCLTGLATLFYNAGQLAEAVSYLHRGLALYEQEPQERSLPVINSLELLAHLYARQGKLAEAEQLYQRILLLTERAEGPEGFSVGRVIEGMAKFYAQRLKNMAKAEQLYRRALAIYERTQGQDSNTTLLCRHNLAGMCHAQGRSAEAETILQNNILLYEQARVSEYFAVPHRINLANNLSLLAHVYSEQGRYAEAAPLLQRALAIKEEGLGAEHLHVAWLLEQYGGILQAAGRELEANEVKARAQAILERSDYRGCCGISNPRATTPTAARD